MNSPPDLPDPEWRSHIDDDDEEEYLAPDPFALPLPPQSDHETK